MSLTLTQHQTPPGRISLAGITPDRLGALAIGAIEHLPLSWGNEKPVLGDFFTVSGSPGDQLVFAGADPRFSAIAGGMVSGTCIVEGQAGDFLAHDMRGGRVIVRGNAGRFAASGLAGGEVMIEGHAGDQLGAALPWLGAGMRGGRVIVRGNVGMRCGDRLRRGEIFIGGNAGDFCAARMVAGSIVLAGTLGAHAGHAMRRGSLFLLGSAYTAPPTFVETVMCADAYLRLVWRDWAARFGADDIFGAFARRALGGAPAPRRWMGDLAADGRAEVFCFGA